MKAQLRGTKKSSLLCNWIKKRDTEIGSATILRLSSRKTDTKTDIAKSNICRGKSPQTFLGILNSSFYEAHKVSKCFED